MLCALVKGAGDLASGVAVSLHRAGFRVVMTELDQPLAIRRGVCFAEAVYAGRMTVEGITAERTLPDDVERVTSLGRIAVVVDPGTVILARLCPDLLVDAVMAKRNLGTARGDAPLVIALGPGFRAGPDADAVIETERGHELGRVIREGAAREDTKVPGEIGGRTEERVLRAPAAGVVRALRAIGDAVAAGDVVLEVGGAAVRTPISGCLRGLAHDGVTAAAGMKVGDVDPRGDPRHAQIISDKARAVGRAVLEAALMIGRERGTLSLSRRQEEK
jgi:xanthine dehydrogenase accessory factor